MLLHLQSNFADTESHTEKAVAQITIDETDKIKNTAAFPYLCFEFI